MNSSFRIEFPFETWHNGRYVNAYTSLIAAVAKAELYGYDVYEWNEERWVRIPRFINGREV